MDIKFRHNLRQLIGRLDLWIGVFAVALGLAVLIGWQFHIDALKSVLPGQPSLKVNIAIGIALSGVSLALLAREKQSRTIRFSVILLSAVVVSLGGLTLSQDVFGWEAGIDQLLFRGDTIPFDASRIGRMSPSAALCFILLGVSFILAEIESETRKYKPIFVAFAATVMTVGLTRLAGGLADFCLGTLWWNSIGVSLNASIGFVSLGAGVLLYTRKRHRVGWTLSLFPTMGFVAGIFLLVVASAFAYNSAKQMLYASGNVNRSNRIIRELREILSELTDLENGQLGYIVMGEEASLGTRTETLAALTKDFDEVLVLAANEPRLTDGFKRLRSLIEHRNRIADESISLRREKGFSAAQQAVASSGEASISAQIKRELNEMERDELRRLDDRQNAFRRISTNTFLHLPLGVFISLTALFVGLFLLNAGVTGKMRIERAVRESEARLAGIVSSTMDAIISINSEQHIILFNAAAESIFRWSAKQALGQPIDHLLPERFRTLHRNFVDGFGRTGVTTRTMQSKNELYGLRANGEEFPIDASISQVDVDGEKIFTVILRDITERKRAGANAELLSAIVESSRDAIVGKDLNGIVTSWNTGAEKMFGYSARDMIGASITRIIPPERLNEEETILARIRKGEPVEHFETVRQRKDGGRLNVSVTVSPIKDSSGRIVGASKTARDISERMKVEAELREREEQLRLYVEHSPAAIAMLDRDMKYRVVSRRWGEDYHLPASNLIGRSHYDVFPEIPQRWKDIHQRCLAGAVERCDEEGFLRADGTTDWIRWEIRPWHHADETIGGIIIFSEDITARKRAVDAQRAGSELLKNVINSTPSFIFVTDRQHRYTMVNDAYAGFLGKSKTEILGKTHSDFYPRDVADAFVLANEGIMSSGSTWQRDETVADSVLLTTKFPLRDAAGVVTGLCGVVTDITERQRLELALREKDEQFHAANERLAEIVRGMSEACFALDAEWRFTFVNDKIETLLRHTREQMLGHSIWTVFSKLAGTPMEQNYRRAMNERVPVAFEAFSPIAERWLDIRLFPSGNGLAAFLLDIHERKHAEEALLESQQQFRTMVDAMSQLAWMAKPDGSIYWFNQRWYDFTGTTPEQMDGGGWRHVHEPASLPKVLEAWNASIHAAQPFEMSFPLRAANGKFCWFLTRAYPFKNADGQVLRWLGTNTDITLMREAEEKVQTLNTELEKRVIERTAQLESANKELEAFSYSVSHDLRAPLRAIDGFSRAVLDDYGAQLPEDGKRYLKNVRTGAQRMGDLIDDLLTFSRLSRAPMKSACVDNAHLVKIVLEELNASSDRGRIDFRVGELPPCQGDSALLKQVWFNLISNAIKYSSKREFAVVEIGCMIKNEQSVYFVRDNGVGFEMRYADKLFGVFQRLHRSDEYEGTGVGLAIVKRIVTRHGGHIWADAALDRGACFSFTLDERHTS